MVFFVILGCFIAVVVIVAVTATALLFWIANSTGDLSAMDGFLRGIMRVLRTWVFLVLTMYEKFMKSWNCWKGQPDNQTCQIFFDWEEPCKVGEHVTFRVSPTKKLRVQRDGSDVVEGATALATLNERQCQALLDNVTVTIRQYGWSYLAAAGSRIVIEYVKEVDPIAQEVIVKFLVRTAGTYEIKVMFEGLIVSGCPYKKRFEPSFIEGSKCVFVRPSSTIVCTSDVEAVFEIQPKDKYGNDTQPSKHKEGSKCRFTFTPSHADESLRHTPVYSSSHVFVNNDRRVEFIMLFKEPGIYKGEISYGETVISNGVFDVLCLNPSESKEMLDIVQKNPGWTPHKAVLAAVGDQVQKKVRKIFLYVSPKLFYVQEYILAVIPLRIAVYRVSPMTKIRMVMSETNASRGHESLYTFVISDGIQPKVTVQMSATRARIVLAMFCYFLRKRLGGFESFEAKQRLFYRELKETMQDIRMTSRQLLINRPSIVYSSMISTKTFKKSDWCKNFGIKFENENGCDYGGLRREWLELLCVQLFRNDSLGMFCCIGTSRLVHPNASFSRCPTWQLKHYEFAGKIVGKCLFESACGDLYRQMVNARFTRSFLAQILGVPPNYQHFEQDDPELFLTKVKYVLTNDVSEMELTFSEEEYDLNGKLIQCVDLIPGGARKPVTAENKEQYLNALAQYRLGTKCEKEITAFKKGLHEIVPEELFTSFDENELEILMCGKSEFDIDDLKHNCTQGTWTWNGNYHKIFNWFCIAVSNMSDEERARLLQFTTGSSLLPHEGFRALNPKFKISISNERGKLPLAHTCFNEIVLSDHDTFEEFERALRTAICEGGEGFAFT